MIYLVIVLPILILVAIVYFAVFLVIYGNLYKFYFIEWIKEQKEQVEGFIFDIRYKRK